LSYAPTVKDRQSSSATSKRTNFYNHNQAANKLTNNNNSQQPDISQHYQTPISSTQDISKSIKSSSVTTHSTNNNNSLVQPKLRISQPGDVYEQEADRVAERMMAMATNPSKPTKPSGTTVKNNDDGHLRIDRKPSQQPRHSIAAGGEAAATPAVTSERAGLEKYNLDHEKNSLGGNISSLTDLSTIRRVVGQNSGGSSNSHPSESFLHLIQPKLKISQPSDAYEKEADLVADQVIGTPPTPDIAIKYQPSLGNDGKKEEEKNNNKTKSITSIVHSRNADGAPSEISPPAEHHESSTMLHSGESTSAAGKAIRLSSDSLFYVQRAIGNNNNVDNKNHNHRQFANNSSKSLVHSTNNSKNNKPENRSGAKNNKNNKFDSARQISNNNILQAKLKVSQPGDIFEQEADRIAEKVMSMPSIFFSYSAAQPAEKTTEGKGIDKKCAACETKGQKEEKIEISRKSSYASNLEASDQATSEINSMISGGIGGGTPLDSNTKEFMESRFVGYDLSNVRIHTDALAAKSAKSVNALAFTIGNHITFGEEQYRPNTMEGKRLLAHELTHVIQQSGEDGMGVGVQRQPAPFPMTRAEAVRALADADRQLLHIKRVAWDFLLQEVGQEVGRGRSPIGNLPKNDWYYEELEKIASSGDRGAQTARRLMDRLDEAQARIDQARDRVAAFPKPSPPKAAEGKVPASVKRRMRNRSRGFRPRSTGEPPSGSGGGGGGGPPSSGSGGGAVSQGAKTAEAEAAESAAKLGAGATLRTLGFLIGLGLQVAEVWAAFAGPIAEGREQKIEEYYTWGFSYGLAATLCGFPEKWASSQLGPVAITQGERVAGFEGIKEHAKVKGVTDGWKYGHNLSDGKRGDYRARGFAAMAKQGKSFALNEKEDITPDGVKNLGRALEPMVQQVVKKLREATEAKRLREAYDRGDAPGPVREI
jgi:Domain of unknown function (DUF4157)